MNKLNENVLEDDYPVRFDYLYVADGKVIRSDIQGTVMDLKRDLKKITGEEISKITTCDIMGRIKLDRE